MGRRVSLSLCLSLSLSFSFFRQGYGAGALPPTLSARAPPTVVGRRSFMHAHGSGCSVKASIPQQLDFGQQLELGQEEMP